jgi:hypothetical protein
MKFQVNVLLDVEISDENIAMALEEDPDSSPAQLAMETIELALEEDKEVRIADEGFVCVTDEDGQEIWNCISSAWPVQTLDEVLDEIFRKSERE